MVTVAEQRFAEQVDAVAEGVAQMVDRYVMMITEQLCSLENQHGVAMARPEMAQLKAAVLEGLNALDGMVAQFRTNRSAR